ncbi:HD domain-containing protein [Halorubrum ezzemoulense]|uniref:HD domain-containing protein n=1 Tax=Halorubrum ezzemoulense TaxID=337243 RepID=UPI0023300209|nr:HD domain-containing protein [Halorubrum ezzemoulense]MDB9281620.1 HD domain-containing protein [Halorubrum ezzemoulense]MDB9285116.1 HD domain-containing protein [Halorubrum ezzemoulense]
MPSKLGPLARELSRPYYVDAFPAHDIYHAKRVRDVALQLADQHPKSVDRDVLAAAAWLHDIGRPLERVGEIEEHGEWAATEATTLLEPEDVATDRIRAIEHCLRAHSIRASSPEPETIEAKLLFDADKLDAAGAVGLVRLACIVGERSGRTGEQYAVIDDASTLDVDSPELPDIDLVREWTRERLVALYTDPGQRLGESRWDFMQNFFDQFAHEINAERGT